ncbi:KAP family P-loop NTPase fold protein [Hymenobacter convexus]|uniref:KAP family P-loop NTPase fold protein n=1 Tax=Hymenobacter sp. CA1UV-4 TaxID=3063782 RepID=UPI002712C81D|nr:P-loop NTPase fold protein [Hymenobacter sp. CA1UV-4]MDO7854565.1 P-loop NTPase fold protein [Hymenobacter sp. CA1UV-4]
MWADNETTTDLLGFSIHTDLVRSVILEPGLLPVTIGVYGDWGGGKTSVLKMLQRDLNPEEHAEGSPEHTSLQRVACLYFNGWLFEGYDDAKSALLSSILVELGEHKRFGPKIRDKALQLIKSVNWMRVARLGLKEVALPALLATATGGASLLPSVVANLAGFVGLGNKEKPKEEGATLEWDDLFGEKAKAEGSADVRTFREDFAKLIADSDIDTLVILIDDLDRCSPQRIVDNLEAIKLFLSVDKTAFVIGADPRIVRHAVRTVYGQAAGSSELEGYADLVTEYLEKVIQVPYYLPWLSPSEVETYISLLFCQQHLQPAQYTDVCTVFTQHRAQDRYSVFGLAAIKQVINPLPQPLAESLAFTSEASALLTEGLKGNPRQVKRFLNALMLRQKLAAVAQMNHLKDEVLVKLMLLEYAHPKQYKELYEWQSQHKGQPPQLQKLETLEVPAGEDADALVRPIAETWTGTRLRRWVTMEPRLADIDLRDYYWISRDRLSSTFSGVAMIPPLVRRLFASMAKQDTALNEKLLPEARQLTDVERGALFDLFSSHLRQQPGDLKVFDALVLLTQHRLPDAATTLKEAIEVAGSKNVPASVGVRLRSIIQAGGEEAEVLRSTVEKLQASDSRAGRASRPKNQ